ncbi:pilus assembly protein TadG-related protein [Streptomyces sp. NPDC013181]|uniref:pilus assembly protein TadG-related protein n=1 Tax=Streptomyces sp. NPDC013181 TaxID=3364864 RepID=UPI00367D347D
MVGLIFVALVFLAFGEADVRRNGAQGAADAAALAAAKDSRSLLESDLRSHITDPAYFQSVFDARFPGPAGNACGKASEFAALNKAADVRCRSLSDGRWGYEVSLKSAEGMSVNIVPGTAGKHATAVAVAVVEPRCTFTPEPGSDPTPDPDPTSGEDATPDPDATPDGDSDEDSKAIGRVRCDGGRDWAVVPENLTQMPDVADLFSVHLAED